MKDNCPDPYKALFSMGCLVGLLGVSLWILFELKLIAYYPRQAHGQLMFFGFLWSFVAGFLMTAIPRMTGSGYAKPFDLWVVLLLLFFQVISNMTGFTQWGSWIYFLQNSFLIYFIVSRFLIKKKIPFDGFLFMPSAFLISILGLILYWYHGMGHERVLYLFCGEAFILNLILGLGSRMIPALSKIPNSSLPSEASESINWAQILPVILLLNFGFFLDYFGYNLEGQSLRFIMVSIIAIRSLGLFKKPQTFTWLGWGLKVGLIFLILGHLVMVLDQRIVGIHLFYIGGFTLITLMVATRVTLAHSQLSLDYEIISKRILIIIFLISLAALSRALAVQSIMGHWIHLSTLFFIGGLIFWFQKHFQSSFQRKKHKG